MLASPDPFPHRAGSEYVPGGNVPDSALMSYRDSHLGKGADYDLALARDPFDAYMARREREIVVAILARLQRAGVRRTLDFACGTGRITQLLDGVAEACFADDVSASMVAEARAKCPRTQFFIQDIIDTPLPIAPVQLVTAFRFFGNAEDSLRARVLEAIRRSLAPGGYLLLNDHENPWALQRLLRRLVGERAQADLHHWKLRRPARPQGVGSPGRRRAQQRGGDVPCHRGGAGRRLVHVVVVILKARRQDAAQVAMLDSERLRHPGRARIQEMHALVHDIEREVGGDGLLPRFAHAPMPQARGLLGRVLLLEPGLAQHEHPVRVSLRPLEQSPQVELEAVQQRAGIGETGANVARLGPHLTRCHEPRARPLPDLERTEPAAAHPASRL